uniref:C-type lectin domain-containing protein n=1 Tax=Meloidogyne floridensis TaxID=298350 RepID=A0A915NKP8_9BILA
MIAFSSATLCSLIFYVAIIAIYAILPTNGQASCPSDWISRVDPIDGITYGYKVITRDWLNYYEAQGYCVRAGGQVASIHSAAENAFIANNISAAQLKQCQTNDSVCATRIAHTSAGWAFLDSLMRSFWFGMNRVQYQPSYNNTLDCSYPDGTPCDYGRFDGVANANTNSPPWSPACPSGSNSSNGAGDLEYCTMFFNATTTLVWNDMSCYQKLGGVVCKMNCSATKTTQTCPSPAVVTTNAAVTTKAAVVTSSSGSAGGSTAKSLTTKSSGTSNGSCFCNGGSCGGGGYKCGSDDWQWKINKKNGKSYAYKAFNYTGCYWQGLAICKKYKAVPCSIQSSDDNDFIVKTVCSSFLSSSSSNSSRKRRATSDTCIYTGIHRQVTNPSSGSVSCTCSDGSSCDYGNDDAHGDTTTTSFTSTTSRATTLKTSTTQKAATTTTQKSTTKLATSFISTSTAAPSNPWAPGCPANSTTGQRDNGGYGSRNCIGINGDGKWVDQSCDRPATAIICMKECDQP